MCVALAADLHLGEGSSANATNYPRLTDLRQVVFGKKTLHISADKAP